MEASHLVVLGLEEKVLRFEVSMADVVLVMAVFDRPLLTPTIRNDATRNGAPGTISIGQGVGS